jgi:signal transduction histidine kinase
MKNQKPLLHAALVRSHSTAMLLLLLFFVCVERLKAAETVVLTNAMDVLALSAKDALKKIPVHVQGVVTVAEPWWGGRFFVQDASGSVFVDNHTNQPAVGDVVEVWGVSHPGGYAPVISKPRFKKTGTAPLPAARQVTIERLMSGAEDGQRVEISGIVRTAQAGPVRLEIELASGGYRLRAYTPLPPNVEAQSLVGAKVLLRGTAAVAFNAPLRNFITLTLFVSQLDDFVIQEPAPTGLFDEPLTPLNGIAQYRIDRSPGNQVHVKGVVTYQRKGVDLFLKDATGDLQVKTRLTNSVSPGDVVEAVGFPAVENYLPVLEDAVFKKTFEPRVELKPQLLTVTALQKGTNHADLIRLQGRLIDRLVKSNSQATNDASIRTTLVLQNTNLYFTAEKVTTDENSLLASIPLGSLVEVTGICLIESDGVNDIGDLKIKSVRMLLPNSFDARILKKPSWLTPRHLLASLGVVFGVLLLVAAWSVMVSKNNLILKSLVREKETAQHELQEAHDQLEERVQERTAQLKVEMTARKESELGFRAVLTERTRLAQELHDTLEQTMTGIALQLDLVANLADKNPGNASHHLKLARSLMRQSQEDLRHSVWGLRSRATEQFNLASALLTNGRQIADGAGIAIEVETIGVAVPLSEVAEENLLRIGQEAITNVVKHSGATKVKIELEYTANKVILRIKDDGKGFTPDNCSGPSDGHFGLLGIRERAERLNGRVEFDSVPRKGTLIRVEIPVSEAINRPNGDSNGEASASAAVEDHEERA